MKLPAEKATVPIIVPNHTPQRTGHALGGLARRCVAPA